MIQYVSAHYGVEWYPDFPLHASADNVFKIPTWQMFFNNVLNKLVSMDILANTFISSDLCVLSKLTSHLSFEMYRFKGSCHEKRNFRFQFFPHLWWCGAFHFEHGTFSEGKSWNCCSICCLSEHMWGSMRVGNSMVKYHSHRRNKRSWIYLAMAFTTEMSKDLQDCVPLDGAKYNFTWAPCYQKAPAACCSSSPGKQMI